MDLKGNTVLITGGGSGIGRGLAEAFHRRGNQVIIAGRHQSSLDDTTAANPGMHARQVDIEDVDQVLALATELRHDFPNLNVLINDAGVMKSEDLKSGNDVSVAEQAVTVNLLGPIRLTAALMPALLAQPRGTVMTLSGGVAFVPMTITPTYSATKAAIHSWSQSLRFQLRDTNVRVLEIAPPYVQSELFAPEGATDPHAMPLADFIGEVMDLLADPPPSGEILVQGVQALRFAERDSTYDQRFADVNSMQW
jgi:uncharacterized oxidoreductase